MGVLVGVLTMGIVASANCLTSTLLLRAALKTGHSSYEGIAEAAGGSTWKAWPLSPALMMLEAFQYLPDHQWTDGYSHAANGLHVSRERAEPSCHCV